MSAWPSYKSVSPKEIFILGLTPCHSPELSDRLERCGSRRIGVECDVVSIFMGGPSDHIYEGFCFYDVMSVVRVITPTYVYVKV